MQINVEYITPQLASEYLKKNTMNRPVNPTHLRHVCRQMREGIWKSNGDSIRFAHTGELLDGQHRLIAICQTGASQEMIVIRGLDREVFNTIDSGKKRGANDVLSLSGYKNANNVASVARMILLKRKVGHPIMAGQSGSYSPTSAEVLELVKSDHIVLQSAEFSRKNKFLKDHMTPSSIAFLHYTASISGQMDMAERFFANVREVTPESIATAAYLFRERLLQNRSAREKMTKTDILALAFRAYRYFRDNKNVRILRPVVGANKRDNGVFDL